MNKPPPCGAAALPTVRPSLPQRPFSRSCAAPSRPLAVLLVCVVLSGCGGGGGGAAPAPSGGLAPSLANIAAPVSLFVSQQVPAIAFSNSGGGSLTGCAVSPELPAGLTVGSTAGGASCQITGTPSALAAQATYTITATNAAGSDTGTVDISVASQPGGDVAPALANIGELAALTVGQQAPAITFINSGGSALTGCTSSPALPMGLALAPTSNNSTCQITGSPLIAVGRVTYTITATNAAGSGMGTIDIAVTAPAGRVTEPSLGDITMPVSLIVGQQAPAITFINSGGSALTGCTSSPTLPMGLALTHTSNGSCQITGSPIAVAGRVIYTITATNAAGSDRATVEITVVAAQTVPMLSISGPTTVSFPAGQRITAIAIQNSAGGSLMACRSMPRLPGNLEVVLSADMLACMIQGVPAMATAQATYAIVATNAAGDGAVDIIIAITPSPVPALQDIDEPQVYEVGDSIDTIEFTNTGSGSLTGCAVRPDLPMGLAVSVKADKSTCQISGVIGAVGLGRNHFVTATNAQGAGRETGRVNIVVLAVGELSQAVDSDGLFGTSGYDAWRSQTEFSNDGVDAAQVLGLVRGSVSCLYSRISQPGLVSFDWRNNSLSSAPDILDFSIGDTEIARISGSADWRRVVVEAAIPQGEDTQLLAWCSRRHSDAATLFGEAYVDQFVYMPRPQSLDVRVVSDTQLGLAWDAFPGATYYQVFRNTDGGAPVGGDEITSGTGQTATSYGDTGLTKNTLYHYWVKGCNDNGCSDFSVPFAATPRQADDDGDALIEVASLPDLNAIRFDPSGAKYKTSAEDPGIDTGCPTGGCIGYELTADLDFDRDGDGSSWQVSGDGAIVLDADDHNERYFNTREGGWLPIGAGSDTSVSIILEGNGHSVSNLATSRDMLDVGMFTRFGSGTQVRNLGLVNNLARYTGSGTRENYVGGLAGRGISNITAVYTTGAVRGIGGRDSVGGLIGYQQGGHIIASFASGSVVGSGPFTGGFVGRSANASIDSCYSTGSVQGNGGDIGGFAGNLDDGSSVSASFASGDVSTRRASSAVGSFAGRVSARSTLTASWGFGQAGDGGGSSGTTLPAGVSLPQHLTAANAPGSWKNGSVPANGAWNFGAAVETPALVWADYDNDGTGYYCQGSAELATLADTDVQAAARARQLAGCSSMPTLIPGQRQLPRPGPVRIVVNAATTVALAWDPLPNAVRYELRRHDSDDVGGATEVIDAAAMYTLTAYTETGLSDGQGYFYWLRACGSASCGEFSPAYYVTARSVDTDGDGLIEILGLADLNSLRYNLAGDFFAESPAVSNAVGCPSGGCIGYELETDLDFDTDDEDTTAWATVSGAQALDADDDNDAYFDVERGGWVPIGNCGADNLCVDDAGTAGNEAADNAPFNAVFEGNKRSIRNLAVLWDRRIAGLFGALGSDAEVRNLNVLGALAVFNPAFTSELATRTSTAISSLGLLAGYSEGAIRGCRSSGYVRGYDGDNDFLGGLVGRVNGGSIIASSSSATAYGANGSDLVGGLVGRMDSGSITASYATGRPQGGRATLYRNFRYMDVVGGLVGRMVDGSITASYALGAIGLSAPGFTNASGNLIVDHDGVADEFGGLVGRMDSGSIAASYAFGGVDGGRGPNDVVGGLVGRQMGGSIAASYARGAVRAGAAFSSALADADRVGALIGWQEPGATATDSWGYGSVVGGEVAGVDGTVTSGVDNRPASASVALAADNVPDSWNDSASNTEAAWFFGSEVHTPALNYADYDGSGGAFHCEGAANPPAGAVLLPGCAAMATAIPGQRIPPRPGNLGYTHSQISEATITWGAVLNAGHFRIYRNEMPDSDSATELTTEQTRLAQMMLDGGSYTVALTEGDSHYYWIEGCTEDECGALSHPIFIHARQADSDGDGLIEIHTNRDLHNIRYSLDGSKLATYAGDPGITDGCPMAGGCVGYELMADLDLEDGDPVVDVRNWAPIGNCGGDRYCTDRGITDNVDESLDNAAFSALFEGHGRTISKLRARTDILRVMGLFGLVSSAAGIRNLGVLDVDIAHATNIGGIRAYLGGLVGRSEGARIVACHATGVINGDDRSPNSIGGLVGYQEGGAIVASFANVAAVSFQAQSDRVGGLVGAQHGGAAIVSSYAIGDSHGGDGSFDDVGGLVGYQFESSISASYATGDSDGGGVNVEGRDTNNVNTLVGNSSSSSITDSWGFGAATNGEGGSAGSSMRPAGVTAATGLTAANAPDSWSDAATPAMDAWDFGDSAQAPALNYADYDGPATTAGDGTTSGDGYHCAGAASPPVGATLVANCATGPMPIPNQRAAAAPGQ